MSKRWGVERWESNAAGQNQQLRSDHRRLARPTVGIWAVALSLIVCAAADAMDTIRTLKVGMAGHVVGMTAQQVELELANTASRHQRGARQPDSDNLLRRRPRGTDQGQEADHRRPLRGCVRHLGPAEERTRSKGGAAGYRVLSGPLHGQIGRWPARERSPMPVP